MTPSNKAEPPLPVLVVSDTPADATLVRELLEDEFPDTEESPRGELAIADVERIKPRILVLAFKDIRKAERLYLELYRRGITDGLNQHRTVVLCSNDSVNVAFDLCRRRIFDDYVLFWPMSHDVLRLRMAVHRAMSELSDQPEPTVTIAAFAAQVRRLAQLEPKLTLELEHGQHHIASTEGTVKEAEREIHELLEGLTQQLKRIRAAEPPDKRDALGAACDLARRGQEMARTRLRAVSDSLSPLAQWAQAVRPALGGQLESLRALATLAERVRATVLVVEDDDFQRKAAGVVLESAGFHPSYAVGGLDALAALGKQRPDLMLLDLSMPDLSGVEVIERMRAIPQLSSIPVIMLTGNSQRDLVTKCLQLGAIDFIVKPFSRETLISRIRRAIGEEAGSTLPSDRSHTDPRISSVDY